jgi:hypothetical protein
MIPFAHSNASWPMYSFGPGVGIVCGVPDCDLDTNELSCGHV